MDEKNLNWVVSLFIGNFVVALTVAIVSLSINFGFFIFIALCVIELFIHFVIRYNKKQKELKFEQECEENALKRKQREKELLATTEAKRMELVMSNDWLNDLQNSIQKKDDDRRLEQQESEKLWIKLQKEVWPWVQIICKEFVLVAKEVKYDEYYIYAGTDEVKILSAPARSAFEEFSGFGLKILAEADENRCPSGYFVHIKFNRLNPFIVVKSSATGFDDNAFYRSQIQNHYYDSYNSVNNYNINLFTEGWLKNYLSQSYIKCKS